MSARTPSTRFRFSSLIAAVAVVCAASACSPSSSSDQPVTQESAPVITGFHPGTTVSWEATVGPTPEDLRDLADSFAGAEATMLLPIDSTQVESAVVEARVDRFVPDPGYVAVSVVVRAESPEDVLVSVQRSGSEPLSCSERSDGRFENVEIRGTVGCALTGGVLQHVIWNESGFRWTSEATGGDVSALIGQLDTWRLFTESDF